MTKNQDTYYLSIAKYTKEAAFVLTGDTFEYLNPAAMKAMDCEDIVDLKPIQLKDMINPDFGKPITELIQTVIAQGCNILDVEFSVRTLKGVYKYFSGSFYPLPKLNSVLVMTTEYQIQQMPNERQKLFAVLDAMPAIVLLAGADRSIRFTNSMFREHFGTDTNKPCNEVLGCIKESTSKCLASNNVDMDNKLVNWQWSDTNSGRTYQVYEYPFVESDGTFLSLKMGIDISEAKRAEKKIKTLNKLHAMLSAINEEIVRIHTKDRLFHAVCSLTVEFGGFAMSWIGLLGRTGFDKMTMVTGCSLKGKHYITKSFLAVKTPHSLVNIINAIEKNGYYLSRQPANYLSDFDTKWEATNTDNTVMASFALKKEGRLSGIISFYSNEHDFFDTEEIQILDKLAADISFALHYIEMENQKKMAFEKIRELSQAVEQGSNIVMITSKTGKIKYVNRRFIEVTGYTKEEVMGKNPSFLKSGKTPTVIYKQLWENILSGKDWHGEFQNKKKDGSLYWESATISPIKNDSGRITNFLAIKEEITLKKFLEERLKYTNRVEAVGQLAAGIAHDFNNILSAINGYVYVLQMKIPHDDPMRNFIDKIHLSTDRAAKLVQGLLAFSKEQTSHMKVIDLNDIVKMMDKLLVKFTGEEIDFKTKFSEEPLPIMADMAQIEQIIINLTSNAKDAMPEGGTFTIETQMVELCPFDISNKASQYALLIVSDTGSGMDTNTQQRAFEPFFTTKQVGSGVGLGLSSVYGIVESHKGYINIVSQQGHGTVFEIYLPIYYYNYQPYEEDKSTVAENVTDTKKETILIAEDDHDVRKIMKKILEREGYRVVEAEDGLDVVQKFKENKDNINILILDVIMPKQNGNKAYEDIKLIRPDIKALFTSGYSDDVIIKKGVLGDNVNFIIKPVSPASLLMNIKRLLKG
ncbi:MAG: PAS domain S-box protein [Candidatus Magnetoovum sp. WYHC-5]|nr:PAS domain S-box protein [Candidatus Magnetoovum sp. WYHC-5]